MSICDCHTDRSPQTPTSYFTSLRLVKNKNKKPQQKPKWTKRLRSSLKGRKAWETIRQQYLINHDQMKASDGLKGNDPNTRKKQHHQELQVGPSRSNFDTGRSINTLYWVFSLADVAWYSPSWFWHCMKKETVSPARSRFSTQSRASCGCDWAPELRESFWAK